MKRVRITREKMFRRVSITQAEYSPIHKLYPGCKLHNRKITIKFLIHKLKRKKRGKGIKW